MRGLQEVGRRPSCGTVEVDFRKLESFSSSGDPGFHDWIREVCKVVHPGLDCKEATQDVASIASEYEKLVQGMIWPSDACNTSSTNRMVVLYSLRCLGPKVTIC